MAGVDCLAKPAIPTARIIEQLAMEQCVELNAALSLQVGLLEVEVKELKRRLDRLDPQPARPLLEREIEHLLKRPVGRPSRRPKVFYHSFQYQAKSWHHARRVIAKVEWHRGELFAAILERIKRLAMPPPSIAVFA